MPTANQPQTPSEASIANMDTPKRYRSRPVWTKTRVQASRSRLIKRETNQQTPTCPSPDVEASDIVSTRLNTDLLGIASWGPSDSLSSMSTYISSGREMVDLFAGAGSSNQPAPSEGATSELQLDSSLVPESIESEDEPRQSHLQYICPYRDRNPCVFNASDFPGCALSSFNTISDVRQHIIEDHRSKYFTSQCQACSSWFRSDTSRNDHLRRQSCIHPPSILADDYDRGINEVTAAQLETGPVGEGMATWQHICEMLFPSAPAFQAPPPPCRKADTSTQTVAQEPNWRRLGDEACSSRTESNASGLAGEIASVEAESHAPQDVARPTMDRQATIPDMTSLRQVGLARVHIEILSLSDHYRRWRSNTGNGPDDSADETDSEGFEDDLYHLEAQESGGPEHTPTRTTTVESAMQSQMSTSAGQETLPVRRNPNSEEDEGDDKRRRKRPRQEPRNEESTQLRFACPYQEAERYQLIPRPLKCFLPAQRNPNGGCADIRRLKDHMTRKHMSSYRCQRCWQYLNTRRKAQEHPETNCVLKSKPAHECFMTLEQETEVDNCGGKQQSEEDTWWEMFRLLISGMAEQGVADLKKSYVPYYGHAHPSFILPSLQAPGVPFQHMHMQGSDQADGCGIFIDSSGSPSDVFSGLSNTAGVVLQSVDTPIFTTTTPQPHCISMPSFEGSSIQLMPILSNQQSDSTEPSDGANASLTPASSLPLAALPNSDTSQMQQNLERQKRRVAKTEKENRALREAINTSRDELKTAEGILDEVLSMYTLEGEVFERLSRAAEILMSATARL